MHKKTNPLIFREGKTQLIQLNSWCTTNKKNYIEYINLSIQIRKIIDNFCLKKNIILQRVFLDIFSIKKCFVLLYTQSLYKIIGLKGCVVAELTQLLKNITPRCVVKVIKTDLITASFIAKNLSLSVEKREKTNQLIKTWDFRLSKDKNILGYQIILSGRLNGSEKTKTFKISRGKLPLHTLDALIDYDCSIAKTANSGTIGCKVYLNVKQHLLKGEISTNEENYNSYKKNTNTNTNRNINNANKKRNNKASDKLEKTQKQIIKKDDEK